MRIIVGIFIRGALLLSFSLFCSALVFAADKKAANPQPDIPKQQPAIAASNAVIILPLGQSRDTRLFFTLSNKSSTPLVLTTIKSAQVSSIEWVPAQGLQGQNNPWTIGVNQSLVLDGKTRYLQLKGLKQSIGTGDEIQFELGFSDGSNMLLMAKARSAYDQIHGH